MAKGLASGGWDVNLPIGEESEELIKSIFDVNKLKLEVKTDYPSVESGNIYIETEYNRGPSGIITTEADWWAQRIRPEVFLLMEVNYLKKMVDRALYSNSVTAGGDWNNTEGALIKSEWVLFRDY